MKRIIAALVLTLSYPSMVAAGLITLDGNYSVDGQAVSHLQNFSGTTSGVLVDLGSGPAPSGDISFELDSSYVSTWTVDFSNNVQTYNLYLLLTFPLQQSIGAPAVPINVVETGAIQGFNIADNGTLGLSTSHDGVIRQPLLPDQATVGVGIGAIIDPSDPVFLDFDATTLSGGGVVTSGPFAGFEYDNGWRVDKVTISVPGVEIEISRVPEPSSVLLISCGFIGLLALSARKRTVSSAMI